MTWAAPPLAVIPWLPLMISTRAATSEATLSPSTYCIHWKLILKNDDQLESLIKSSKLRVGQFRRGWNFWRRRCGHRPVSPAWRADCPVARSGNSNSVLQQPDSEKRSSYLPAICWERILPGWLLIKLISTELDWNWPNCQQISRLWPASPNWKDFFFFLCWN